MCFCSMQKNSEKSKNKMHLKPTVSSLFVCVFNNSRAGFKEKKKKNLSEWDSSWQRPSTNTLKECEVCYLLRLNEYQLNQGG